MEELGDSSDPMADDVVQQSPGQPPHPMSLVPEERTRISVAQVVAIGALHVYGRAPQIAAFDEAPHATRGMAELIVVPRRELQAALERQRDEPLRLLFTDGNRLLDVHMAAVLEA